MRHVLLALSLFACADHAADLGPSCLAIVEACHEPGEAGDADAEACHEVAHDADEAACTEQEADCVALCEASTAGT
jgi:hypothetical protein